MEWITYVFDFGFDWLADALQSEVGKMTIAFMVAARLHRRWVKKDMAEQFGKITAAIEKVAVSVGADLSKHTELLTGLREDVNDLDEKFVKLDERVSILEQATKPNKEG